MSDLRRVWVVTIDGPTWVTISAPGTPTIRHRGGHTLAQMFCTRSAVDELLQKLPDRNLVGKLVSPEPELEAAPAPPAGELAQSPP